ncbi:MAG: glycosyltransferase [Deltaproteobacteria bacterium]|nr:MAG: glycosyltransferase [Deltaproteobacteria bacterium]
MNILQVCTSDIRGGAEKVAWNLFQAYRARGHNSWLAVGSKQSNHADVIVISNNNRATPWSRFCRALGEKCERLEAKLPGLWRIPRVCEHPWRGVESRLGIEDFNYPGTRQIINLTPQKPNIVHCHNLHGSYFDLRALPWLSQQVVTILTLHDAWLMSGHCAHSLDCERWKIGCGHCPDLNSYPAIKRDATAYNWRRKRDIHAHSRLYISTPCDWLMRKVEQSILAPAVLGNRVIPNGVDLSIFHPADKRAVRPALGIRKDTQVLLFTANRVRQNVWKDYQTIRAAIALLVERVRQRDLLFIALGDDASAERIGRAEVRFVPYEDDPEAVARYYQAADLYLHAARADTFPNTILEALACGTPVVATAVGGIPEQVKGLEAVEGQAQTAKLNRYDKSEATGILVPAGDAAGMAAGIERLMKDDSLRGCMGENAARDARERFDLQRQVDSYLEWYGRILLDNGQSAKAALELRNG